MTATVVIAVIGVIQTTFIVVLLIFLAARRGWDHSKRATLAVGHAALLKPMRDWLVADGNVQAVVDALRAMPTGSMISTASLWVRNHVPAERRPELAVLLRAEPRLRRAAAGATSRWWWRRVEAARALSVVATPADRDRVRRLLEDPQPEVSVAAVACLPLIADSATIDRELDRYATLTPMMRQYLLATLREMPALVEPRLVMRIVVQAEPIALAERVRLAAALDLSGALRAALALTAHEHPQVRAAVASALKRMPRVESVQRLALLLRDPVAKVREEAAASLGALGSPTALGALEAATRDIDWLVRRRAGLALAQVGDRGRAVVRALRNDPDAYVSSMATMVSGLSESALLELTEN